MPVRRKQRRYTRRLTADVPERCEAGVACQSFARPSVVAKKVSFRGPTGESAYYPDRVDDWLARPSMLASYGVPPGPGTPMQQGALPDLRSQLLHRIHGPEATFDEAFGHRPYDGT
jgi:hypothetical protein